MTGGSAVWGARGERPSPGSSYWPLCLERKNRVNIKSHECFSDKQCTFIFSVEVIADKNNVIFKWPDMFIFGLI